MKPEPDGPQTPETQNPRRQMLGGAALTAFCLALGGAAVGMARLPKPALIPGPTRRVKLGPPAEVPEGGPHRPEGETFALFRDAEGIYAISLVCTHLGCIVGSSEEGGFRCPCHGSEFRADGRVSRGPAPSSLPWLEVSLSPDGMVVVDQDTLVAPGARLKV